MCCGNQRAVTTDNCFTWERPWHRFGDDTCMDENPGRALNLQEGLAEWIVTRPDADGPPLMRVPYVWRALA